MGDLEELARTFRRRIIAHVEQNGGHLASNLGVVELTIALHRIFDFPEDRLVFDVSHQCYVHKLLSGRGGECFDRMRRTGGYSGYCDAQESPFDPFTAGHGGTALSSALGLAVARDLRKDGGHVVALIGDGSLSCGLTMEALQHVAGATERLIVVLNDNGHSIDRGVGAVAEHLLELAGAKNSRRPPCLFRDIHGLEYIGPVDGHDFSSLLPSLTRAKLSPKPVLVHVCTEKGRGHLRAQATPANFHGVTVAGNDGSSFQGKDTYSEVFGRCLCALAEKDPRIVAVTAAMGQGTGLQPFLEKFPDRFFDVGIAEGHALTFAAGLARGGLRPVCAIYSPFIHRAVDNFFHDICLQNLPVVLCMDRAGLSCSDGDTHHGLFDIALLAGFPNVTFAQPASLDELGPLLSAALRVPGPFAMRYPRGVAGNFVPAENPPHPLEMGRATVLRRGSDLTIWALGQRRLEQALELAKILEKQKISTEVVNARFICPIDRVQLERSGRCGLVVAMEDHVAAGGFGSLLRMELHALDVRAEFLSISWPMPVGFAEDNGTLELRHGQSTEQVLEKILRAHGHFGRSAGPTEISIP
jgi:1-deoxy-D-xylulose-5-phosphate synthase